MSDFPFTEEQKMLRDMVREFVNAEIKPIAQRSTRRNEIPPELIQKMGDLGLLGAVFPPEYGGGGFGEVGYCLMQEEIAPRLHVDRDVHRRAPVDRGERHLSSAGAKRSRRNISSRLARRKDDRGVRADGSPRRIGFVQPADEGAARRG